MNYNIIKKIKSFFLIFIEEALGGGKSLVSARIFASESAGGLWPLEPKNRRFRNEGQEKIKTK